MEEVPQVDDTQSKLRLSVSTAIAICAAVVLLIFITFGILHYLNILRLDYAFPSLSFLPHIEKNIDTTTVSLQNITPVPKGDPFKEAVMVSGSDIALTTIPGRVIEVANDPGNPDQKLMVMQKTDGTLIKEPLTLTSNTRVTVIDFTKGETTEKVVSIQDIHKGDDIIMSYNLNTKTYVGVVGGIRISR